MTKSVLTDHKTWCVDGSAWPLVVVTILTPSIQDDELLSALHACTSLLVERGGAYSLVVDNRRVRQLTASQRRILAESMGARADRAREYCRGVAMILDSPLMRGVLTAIFWLRRPVVPTEVFANVIDATRWARARHAPSPEPVASSSPPV